MDRRKAVFVALGVMVVIGVALVAVAVTREDDADVAGDGPTTTAADDTTTTTERTTTTPTTAFDQRGATVVAVGADGRVVVLDAGSGEVDRVLLEGIAVDDPAKNGIARAPDRGEIFVTRPRPAGTPTELVQLAADGSASESLGEGVAPSVSPDGSHLAYVRFIDRGSQSPAPVLVIRELATGDERELARDNEPDFHFIPDTAWTADGERVAFVAGEILTGLYVVDSDATSLDEAQRIGPVAREDGTSWSAVTAFGEDTLAVVETCCDVVDRQRWLVLAVNLSQREVEGGLLPGDRVEASRLDSPSGERRLLYITDLRPGGGTLHRWDGSGEPEAVADEIIAAAW